MAESVRFNDHVQEQLGRAPELAQRIVARTQAVLRDSGTDLSLAQDRNLLFGVAEAVQARRADFESALTQHIQDEVRATQGDGPSGRKLHEMTIDQLTLVDENQAEQDIEISRTVQLIDLVAEWELRELQACTSALQGDTTPRPHTNPLRPAVFARALGAATRVLPLSAGERNMLLRLTGRVLADCLREHYREVSATLRSLGCDPVPFKAVTHPRRSAPPSSLIVTQPGALQSLLDRMPLPPPPAAPAAAAAAHAGDLTFGVLSRKLDEINDPQGLAARRSQAQVSRLLNTLFQQMQADAEVPAQVRQLIGQMEPVLQRAAQQDTWVLRSDQHPAWRLINQMAAYAAGYGENDAVALRGFLAFMQPRVARMLPEPGPGSVELETTLKEMQQFIVSQSQAAVQQAPQAVARLREADQRLTLHPLLQQQVANQVELVKLPQVIKDFLCGPWVEVLTHTMATTSPEDDESQAMLCVVDDLVQSLQRPESIDAREALRRKLPDLSNRLQRGMASINMPRHEQDTLLEALMRMHTRVLMATPKPPKLERERTGFESSTLANLDALLDDLRFAQADGRPLDTNLGSLPTVPMAFGENADDAAILARRRQWADALTPGTWCKLFMQGQWTTARLLWVSENRQFYMFGGDLAGRLHSLSRRALERLRAEGLATSLEDRSLMQRAVDSMVQELDS